VSVPRSCATATLLTLVTTKAFDSVLALKSSGFAGVLFVSGYAQWGRHDAPGRSGVDRSILISVAIAFERLT
jgi:hypothetical protein